MAFTAKLGKQRTSLNMESHDTGASPIRLCQFVSRFFLGAKKPAGTGFNGFTQKAA